MEWKREEIHALFNTNTYVFKTWDKTITYKLTMYILR